MQCKVRFKTKSVSARGNGKVQEKGQATISDAKVTSPGLRTSNRWTGNRDWLHKFQGSE